MGALGSLLSGFASSSFNAVRGVLGGVFTSVTSWLGGMLSSFVSRVFTGIGQLVAGGLGKLADGVKGALGATASALKYGLYAVVGSIGAAVVLLNRSIQATSTWGRTVGTLSAQTGLSNRAAGGVASRFGALGLESPTGNPALYGLRASVYGVPSYTSPDFLARTSDRFNSLNGQGIMGNMMAQQMARSLGLDSPDALRTLAGGGARIREQQRFAGSVRSGLGIDDAAVASASRSFDLLSSKLKVLGQGALVRLGQAILPRVNDGLSILTSLLERNAGSVSRFIEQGVNATFSAFGRLADFLYRTGPEAALGFASTFLKGMLAVTQAAPSLWSGLLKGVDIAQQGFEFIARTGASAFDLLTRGVSALSAGVSAFVQNAPSLGAALSGVWNSIRDGVNRLVPGLLPGGGAPSMPNGNIPNTNPPSGPLGMLGNALGIYSHATGPGANVGRNIAGALGGDDPVSQGIGGMLGRQAFLQSALRLAPKVLGNPYGLLTLGAGALGAGIYNYGINPLQRMIDPMAPSGAGEAFSNLWSRMSGTDPTTAAGTPAQQRAFQRAQRQAQASGAPSAFGAAWDAARNGWNNPQMPTTPDFVGMMRRGLDATPQGTWSQSLESRFGPGLRDGASSAAASIRRSLEDLDRASENPLLKEMLELMRQTLGETQKQTRVLQGQPTTGDNDRILLEIAEVVASNMSGRARDRFIRLTQR